MAIEKPASYCTSVSRREREIPTTDCRLQGRSWRHHDSIKEALDKQKTAAKEAIAVAQRKDKKRIEAEQNALIAELEDTLETARQHEWLTEKFGDGEYQDVLGLCKIATIDEISEKNYSLTPGAYVGVAEQEDDGVDFHERMNEIHTELASLNKEANVLMSEIMKEWETLNTK